MPTSSCCGTGRNELPLKATVSESLLRSSPLNIEAAVNSGLESAQAAKELKAIEKHKETWLTERKKEREMREDLVQEEIGNTLHLMRSRK